MKKSKMSLLFVVIFLFSLFSSNAFAISDDKIMSQDIKEADGTSGQDTNTGSGIKTGHIQDGAVTPAKIGFYSNVIIVAPSGGDFTSPVDAMNAITDASASNPYLVKIMPGVYNIGSNSVRMKPYVDIEGSGENVTIVSGSNFSVVNGGSNTEIRFLTVRSTCQYNCQTVGNSAFAIFNEGVTAMKITHVKAEVTKTCGCGGVAIYNSGSNVTIGDVTATITGTDGDNVAITNFYNSFVTMNNINASVSGTRWAHGVQNNSTTVVVMNNVSAKASGGIDDSGVTTTGGSTVTMTNVTAEGNHNGIVNEASIMKIDHSVIIGPDRTIWHTHNDGTTFVGSSRLEGGIVAGSGITCAGVYDENYIYYATTCP